MSKPSELGALPNFSGKIVWLRVSRPASPESRGILLEFAEFTLRGDEVFITGRSPTSQGRQWVSQRPVTVAWRSVASYTIFPSREEYLHRLRLRRGHQRKSRA